LIAARLRALYARVACPGRRAGRAPAPRRRWLASHNNCAAQNKKGRPPFGSGLSRSYLAGSESEARSPEPAKA